MPMLLRFNIRDNKEIWRLIKQFIKFGIVGVSNTLISLSIYYIFILINKNLYIMGNTAGFIISVLNAYYLNNKFVFSKTEKGNTRPLIKTFVAYGSTFLMGTGFLYMMVNHWGISEVIAPLLNLLLTVPLNFVLNKFWAFK